MNSELANLQRASSHRIQNDEELAACTAELFKLTSKVEPTPEENEAINLLTLLIEHYEVEQYPVH